LQDVESLAARVVVTVRFVRRLVEERRVPYVKVGRLS
jgi:excisionase family DNA binding protein